MSLEASRSASPHETGSETTERLPSSSLANTKYETQSSSSSHSSALSDIQHNRLDPSTHTLDQSLSTPPSHVATLTAASLSLLPMESDHPSFLSNDDDLKTNNSGSTGSDNSPPTLTSVSGPNSNHPEEAVGLGFDTVPSQRISEEGAQRETIPDDQIIFTNGHGSSEPAGLSETVTPPKRGPGRPARTQTATGIREKSSDLNSRPRRSTRITTVSSITDPPRSKEDSGKLNQKTAQPTSMSAHAHFEPAEPFKTITQRTSKRIIRPPGKFLHPTGLITSTGDKGAKLTPANQQQLLQQQQHAIDQQTGDQPKKRGPGRPANNTLNLTQRSTGSANAVSFLPPPNIPAKRGPGRPPRNPQLVKAASNPTFSTTLSRAKSKPVSPTAVRPNHSTAVSVRSNTSVSPSKSDTSSSNEPTIIPKRGPGRPPKNSDGNNAPASASTSWRHHSHPQVVTPFTTPGSRSRKRYSKSDAEYDDDSTGTNDRIMESGFTPRKRRNTQNIIPGHIQAVNRNRASTVEAMEPPKPLTPLDRARQAKITEWEVKLHEVIDHHDSLVRELYHLETYTTTLTYDPVKIKMDHSDRMLRFLRNFELWSQVPDLVSNVQLHADRISTRKSATEQREMFVDMLQKNVEVALPRRGDIPFASDLIRHGLHRNLPLQLQSFEDYLNSFVYVDDEEVTPQEADKRAASNAKLLDRIDALKAEGRLGEKPPKPFVDPEVPKLHYNWLMEHIMTSSRLIKEEGRLQMARARKVSKMITRHFEQLHGKSERDQRLEEKRLRKLAKLTAGEVKKKWRYVEGIIKARHKALLKEEQEEAGKRHLNLILEHSTQILGVQHSTLNMSLSGTPRTPGTPGTPGHASDALATSDVLSDLPSTPPVTDATSRRSSVAPSAVSSDAELDTGDAEYFVKEADVDDETTLANEESGSEDDEAEISGLQAEMDIPIEELLKQYGYQLSGGEESDDDDEQDNNGNNMDTDEVVEAAISIEEIGGEKDDNKSEEAMEPIVKVEVDAESGSLGALNGALLDTSMDIRINSEERKRKVGDNNDSQGFEGLSSALFNPRLESEEGRIISSMEIAKSLPEDLKAASNSMSTAQRLHSSKRRRLSLSELYKGPPLPFNPFDEVDDERTMEEEEEEDLSDPEELAILMQEKDMPIEDLLDKYDYEAESSEYSDSYYDSDSEYEENIMSLHQRARSADPRYVVTLQDVAHSRKFPTRPSSEFTDTDTEYDDNRTISIYGTDDELCLGDMLPLLSPETPPKSTEIDTFTTGANVKTKIPFLLRHQLREYQHVGMDWLANLYANGLNGILADEMGLGKTMQTIALLAHLACEHGVWGPHLIVVPTSVMLNWEMEFKKWCPGFKIMTYYGSPRERKEKRVGWSRENAFHVCITSYQLVVQDQAVFRRKAWQYLILDEAHNIKNFRSQRWQTLLNFNSARRLLLTGTPLQNNLMELWSLLYFLMPNGVSQTMPVGFANQKEFQEWFSHPVDRMIEGNEQQDEDSKAAIARLHTVLRPYLLRRLKSDVEAQMPAKYEHIVYCRLSKRQRFLYDDFMSRAKTRETLASGNFLSIINCLMQLRKVCNHPDLFEVRPIVTSFAMPSATASYEITEFLVRRRMFSEIDKARESINLDFLGLVFTNKEERLSKMDLESYEELNATPLFLKRAHEFSIVQSKSLTIGTQYQDVRQYSSLRRHRQLLASKQRWEQLAYVNTNRCHTQVMFGSSLLDMCHQPVKSARGCFNILQQVSDPRQYLDYTNAIAQAVLTSEARFHQNEETIKRFAFVTPAVIVRDYSWAPIHVNPQPTILETICQQAIQLFHPVASCLQVQFPDKRLLQFDCGKLQKLDSLLRELKSGGHRALIFTQMTKVLDILEIFLNIHGHRYLRLDGATKVENRQHLTDRFNSDPKILVFILSTRSGGVGINLTGADTVIFYDSDWNPSMDRQCQDRCHRIGQTRDVHIYRFVSEFTIEENMLKKANQKRMLDNVVIQEGGFTTDYFQKMDWRDMLGEEDLAKIGDLGPIQANGEPRDLSTVHGADLEQALAAAEDENDVLAMQQAKHEMEGVDQGDFSEAGATPNTVSNPKEFKASSAKNIEEKSIFKETSVAKVQFLTGASTQPDGEGEEEGEVIEIGHVDEYMLRFMEREYGHYVGFGASFLI
ncbi:SNF2 family N-terminal domain-domain-containing protein [Lobosporangium transversale]|uniref:DNA helicase n=1 Tax=Lobosporangium transversale TaxID=64571 RepID=A0A1Y2GSM4_9FUNG|nr:SNF2 family N-terminal domain-domain-containing protein [Lobosporangium transversale]ORZ16655.1 SNF2 family N-terminal domain-domain-containing protein [Lobosporangium transversale]|eukprot:XP_021881590.1 SNF2 family N-terminal domain-domain-containing protein [Lobosporangium transversale]